MALSVGNRDAVGGLLLAGLGAAATLYTATHYDLGKMKFIGPGAFPLGASILLVVLGLLIAATGRPRGTEAGESPDLGSFVRIAAALGAFAILIRPFGAIPAVAALTFVSMASREPGTLRWAIIMTVLLSASAIGLFVYGLEMRVDVARWPF